ncbi:MAG TPA: hypothetical protein VG713_14710, partial [Pirellulales bacterium]|nr:hypothetical protein [Pirellulales bacterium]
MFDRTLCEPCAEADVGTRDKVPPESVARLSDPTVCAQCGHDNGSDELPTIAQMPVCPACEQTLRNRAFPAWVKLSLATILVLAVVAMGKNLRFFQGYVAAAKAGTAAAHGDLDRAASLYGSALAAVPEERGYDVMQKFFTGIAL